ncbi:potassium channel family protein [Streptomyces sp. NPDC002454]
MTRPPPTGHRVADPVRRWTAIGSAVALLVTAYFLVPEQAFGPERPVLSWTVFALGLALIALLILRHIRDVLLEREGTHPAFAIIVLMCATVLVFAVAYRALARDPGEFDGLATRVDALYFTVVTLATVGFGDITARGQSARVVVILQIVYTFVFLTAAATAVTTRIRSRVTSRSAGRRAGRRAR